MKMDVAYELSAKKVERNVLEVELPTEELWENDRYRRLQRQIKQLKEQANDETEAENQRSEKLVFGTST